MTVRPREKERRKEGGTCRMHLVMDNLGLHLSLQRENTAECSLCQIVNMSSGRGGRVDVDFRKSLQI